VAPLLDGRRSADDVIGSLRGEVSAAEVYYVLARLEARGYLCEGDEAGCEGAAWWALQDVEPRAAAVRLAETAVSLSSCGDLDAGPLRGLLGAMHVRVGEPGARGVVVTDDYLRHALADCNRQALCDGRPWLLCRPLGAQLWLGPLFRPGHTGCWECLAQRLRGHRAVECYLQAKKGWPEPPPPARSTTPAALQAGWGLAAQAVAAWVARGELPELEGKVVTLDLTSWKAETHTLVRRPQCPACGRPGAGDGRSVAPLVLHGRKKTFTADGGHRVVGPEETLERFGHHVSAITGAVSGLHRWGAAADGVLHVYAAGENPARRSRDLPELKAGLRSASCGKGTTDVQARASGLCEALERYSAVFRGDEPLRRARLDDLGGDGLHPNAVMGFSDRQYRERDLWNARPSHFNRVPAPFDPDAATDWTPVWSLTCRQVRYLPTAFCYLNYPDQPGAATCVGCTNGNAAGNTPEEAVLQGFLELVERDAVALWWYNCVPRPGVDLDSFDEPYLARLASFLRGRQRELWVLDLTNDLQIPVFAALSRRTGQAEERIMVGFGAHLDARVALLRAVTELNQMLTWLLDAEGGKAVPERVEDEDVLEWTRTATLANQPYLAPAAGVRPRAAADFPRCWGEDLRDDVLACQSRVERLGLEVLVHDLTRPDIGLPVVKVIVPGLRHFWARFAPGRLYDVPVQLGWLPRPPAEDQLNPVPMFL
jgi:ribosomal protein S12 methylthiotransferase accessory factor